MKTAINHRGNKFNNFVMKDMLDNTFIDYDEFPQIDKGDWLSLTFDDDKDIKYGIVVDIFVYSPYDIDVSMCYQDIYYVKSIDGKVYECFGNNICSHICTQKIKSFLKELKNKTKIIE